MSHGLNALDIGFGDIIFPEPELSIYPTILDFPAPQLRCYSRESAIAEKFEAMVKLGQLNSRMKDFYDIWMLSRQFDFDSGNLIEAIKRTFAQRRTEIPPVIVALSREFGEAKQRQWSAFGKRVGQDYLPAAFAEVLSAIRMFLEPLVAALGSRTRFSSKWIAGGPWR